MKMFNTLAIVIMMGLAHSVAAMTELQREWATEGTEEAALSADVAALLGEHNAALAAAGDADTHVTAVIDELNRLRQALLTDQQAAAASQAQLMSELTDTKLKHENAQQLLAERDRLIAELQSDFAGAQQTMKQERDDLQQIINEGKAALADSNNALQQADKELKEAIVAKKALTAAVQRGLAEINRLHNQIVLLGGHATKQPA
ncbi:hypothetical protein M1466_01145 [Candidatus Dependentiae bacterium]|nr:hypothetical protein [Candidatus Dependentiae bacterium]